MSDAVPSPQTNPALELEPATRMSRFWAFVFDQYVVSLPWAVLLVTALMTPFERRNWAIALFLSGWAATFMLQLVLLAREGQTLGKKFTKIRIVDARTGENKGFTGNVVARWFANGILGLLPFYLLLDALFIYASDRRCIHDLIAGTIVVKVKKAN